MNTRFTHSEFYFKSLIKGISYEIDSQGETIKRLASCTRLQICNLPPLELPTAIDNFVYVRITNIEGMKKFFGTLERNRSLLVDMEKMLDSVESTGCKSLFDPALGEIVLVKIGEKFVRGCVISKIHFMTCTTYLIDSGLTMEVELGQLYVINEELLKIPPQAFLMLLDVDVEEPLISNEELNTLVKNTLVAFRLKSISENGEAFVGAMIIRNQVGEICDLGSIMLEGVHTAVIPHQSDEILDNNCINQTEDIAVFFTQSCLSTDLEEDERSIVSLCSSDSEKFEEESDVYSDKQMVSVGSSLRAIYIPIESSGPGLFYLHFLDGPTGFEDVRTYSTSLFGKYNNIWHKLLEIPHLEYNSNDKMKFVQISSVFVSYNTLFYGGKQVETEWRSRLKAVFACQLSHSAPKPFNDNRYSTEAKSYFTMFVIDQIFDVYITRISRRYVLEVEILLPGGGNILDKLCELNVAQRRWAWKAPSYNFELISQEQLVRRTDDEDDVQMIFTVQVENKRNDLTEFQKHLKPTERILRNPKVGDICIAKCEEQLFRCEIVDTTDEDHLFVVNYVDYGEEQELNASSLYAIDNQEEVVFETPVFGIKCRLEEVCPAGNGLDVRTGTWSRTALRLINRVIPLNKHFTAFIGPPYPDGVHPIRIVDKTLVHNDLVTTLVMSNLAVYKACSFCSLPTDLSSVENLEIRYLNVEDGVIYGIPNTSEFWLTYCQSYLEKVKMEEIKEHKRGTTGIILYENRHCRVIKLHHGNKESREKEERYFLVDEGRTIEFCENSEVPPVIDPQAAFFLRTCPALAVGFLLRDRRLLCEDEQLLKNICSRERNVYLSVCILRRKKNQLYSVNDMKFTDGTSLSNLLDNNTDLFGVNLSANRNNLSEINNDEWNNDSNFCHEGFFSNASLFKEHEIAKKKEDM
uniref:Tudor domain-containing protein n=1 Tax=Setaria digitata TaxID=48799 RepID=A0A915Q0E5_9BILA